MPKILLSMLLGFFSFAVEPPVPEPQADPDPQADLDLDLGAGDPEPDPQGDPDPVADSAAALATERSAREAAEARAEQYQRDLAEARAAQRPAAQSEDQKLYAQEEARLSDPKTTDLERWQITSNRTLRANNQASGAALFEARDIADRTAFRALEVTKPALYKRYEKRVEEELAKVRSKGGNTTREGILRFLIGSDAVEGKLAPQKRAAAAPANPAVRRGALPGARSDVRGKGAPMSNREKLAAKLDGVPI